MKITLGDFEIANGYDRTLIVLSEESLDLQQRTQAETLSRAEWLVAFPERASRSISLSYQVAYPPCETLEAALMQSRMVPVGCPKGGALKETHEGERVQYAQAWVTGISAERMGVSNRFSYSVQAVEPTAHHMVLDEAGEILEDEEGNELEY